MAALLMRKMIGNKLYDQIVSSGTCSALALN